MTLHANNVHGMESQCINGPDVVYIVDSLPMAFEGVLLLLSSRVRVEILDSDTTFDRTNREA